MMPADATCRTCGYRLLGLTRARCPECGEHFDPLDRNSFRSAVPARRSRRRPKFEWGTLPTRTSLVFCATALLTLDGLTGGWNMQVLVISFTALAGLWMWIAVSGTSRGDAQAKLNFQQQLIRRWLPRALTIVFLLLPVTYEMLGAMRAAADLPLLEWRAARLLCEMPNSNGEEVWLPRLTPWGVGIWARVWGPAGEVRLRERAFVFDYPREYVYRATIGLIHAGG